MMFGLSYLKLAIYGAAALAIVSGYFIWQQHVYNSGWDNAIHGVEKQNEVAKQSASKAQRTVDECYDASGVWDVITGKCQR